MLLRLSGRKRGPKDILSVISSSTKPVCKEERNLKASRSGLAKRSHAARSTLQQKRNTKKKEVEGVGSDNAVHYFSSKRRKTSREKGTREGSNSLKSI